LLKNPEYFIIKEIKEENLIKAIIEGPAFQFIVQVIIGHLTWFGHHNYQPQLVKLFLIINGNFFFFFQDNCVQDYEDE